MTRRPAEEVSFDSSGETLTGTVFRPAQPSTSGVVLAPSVHGCNDYVLDVGSTLADVGFTSMVVDIYARGDHPGDLATPEKIQAAVGALPDRRVTGDVVAAGGYLREVTGGPVGVLGFCVGGVYAMLAGCSDTFSAAAAFYGMIRYAPGIREHKENDPIDSMDRLQVPLLAHFGTLDPWCPPDHRAELRERLAKANKVHEVYEYPGAGHAFHEFHRPQVYRPVAAATAWSRTITFFGYYLRGEHP